jgi:hypothetical protein
LGFLDRFFRKQHMTISRMLSDILLADVYHATGGWISGWQLLCLLLLVVLIVIYFVVKRKG